MNMRITIEIDGREITTITIQPSNSSGVLPTAPPEVLARAKVLGATDAGPAQGETVSFEADMLINTGVAIPTFGDFVSTTAFGAIDAGPAPAESAEVNG